MDRLIGNKLEKQNNVVDFDLSDVVINKKKVYEEIADQIRERIINGQFKPGDKLPSERLLAKNFGVSVPIIRQALGTLSATGYIKIIHGSGTFVTSYQTSPFLDLLIKNISMEDLSSPEILFQLTEIRKIFESQVVSLSAVRRTDEDLESLNDILTKEKCAVKNLDIDACGQLDVMFHIALARASKNVIAEKFINSLFNLLLHLIKMTRKIPEYLRDSIYFHENLYNSVLAKDSKMAKKYMEEHLNLQEKALYELYEMNLKEEKEN